MTGLYPGKNFFKTAGGSDYDTVGLLGLYSVTYNTIIEFLPYDLKITENLTPEWNQETVIGRMDPIARFKRMGRTMNVNFKARAREDLYSSVADSPYLPYDDLLHSIDHLKALMYPKYNANSIMTSPPLFRIQCENLILAGPATIEEGVLCYITALKADPIMEKNSVVYFGSETKNNYNTNVDNKQTRQPKPNERKLGNLEYGMYPKGFDINIAFVVLNENLSTIHQPGQTLETPYFYNFVTNRGPQGGHPGTHRDLNNKRLSTSENLDNNAVDVTPEERAKVVDITSGE